MPVEPALLGLDLGSVMIKVALCSSEGEVLCSVARPARGRPLASLAAALDELAAQPEGAAAPPVRVAVTGIGQGSLTDIPAVQPINEVLATARVARKLYPQARTVVDLGGQYTKWILLSRDSVRAGAVEDFATNGLCAAGSGAFLEQQAGRLQLTPEQLGDLAAGATSSATIAGRCSVFAKSDMIHLQQKGTPTDAIALGLCRSLVRTFLSTVLCGQRLEPPVVLVGGGAANPGLVRAFVDELGLDSEALLVPERPLALGAEGAVLLAQQGPTLELSQLTRMVRAQHDRRAASGTTAGAPSAQQPLEQTDQDPRPDEDPPPVPGPVEAYLGVDVGSVSTNLVLIRPGGEVLQGIYLSTRGQPVAVLREGLERIQKRYGKRLQVLGVGTTGSGRHLAGRVLGADVVHNEITAQMISAAFHHPGVDTIFEIGGQDAKFIGVRDGRLADFEMNKVCAAGTGSFLEEQAERLGLSIVNQFSELALAAEQPVDLGTRCTVFMDAELVRAQQRDTPLEDLCAGLAYSVARNYLERVVAGRPVGRRVVFSGGTASNRAVVAAFRRLLGREVVVHPYNRISGAIGAALLAIQAQRKQPYETRFLGLDSIGEPEVRNFECPRCENRCQVNRIKVDQRVVHFGDACERYSERDREHDQQPRPFPELFSARQEMLEAQLPPEQQPGQGGESVGLVRGTLNLEYLPLWTTFLSHLGYRPLVGQPTSARLLRAQVEGVPPEVCLPVKTAALHVSALLGQKQVQRVFIPALLECPGGGGDVETTACLYNQQLADMLGRRWGRQVVSAKFALQDGLLGLMEPTLDLARALGRRQDEVARALEAGRRAQAAFTDARQRLGRRVLATDFPRAVVVLGKPYNLHDPQLNLALARHLEQVGLPAIPMDLLPLTQVQLEPRWDSVPWHFNRQQLRALRLMQQDGRLFPLLVSSFGCGPDAFVIKHLEELLSHRPRLLLEFDEHRGEAGLVTRLEAFTDEIDEHQRGHAAATPPAISTPGPNDFSSPGRIVIPNVAHLSLIYRAIFRRAGWDAEVMPLPDDETIRVGEKHASGQECHPWTIFTGEMIQALEQGRLDGDAVFLSPDSMTPCLLRQYPDAHRIVLQRRGIQAPRVLGAGAPELERVLGTMNMLVFYEGLLAADYLYTLATRLRPYELQPGSMDRLLQQGLERLAVAIEGRRRLAPPLRKYAHALWRSPRSGHPGQRPVVGVTGDLYTRLHPSGNAHLFQRLEDMGCEVWPSPYFAQLVDISTTLDIPRLTMRGRLRVAASESINLAVTTPARKLLERCIPRDARPLVLEPGVSQMSRLVRPYLSPGSNFLVVQIVAKLVDFLQRGAAGAVNAAGLNCMVGTSAAAAVPAIRADHDQAPVINLFYDGQERPAQRIRLETFAQQVLDRA